MANKSDIPTDSWSAVASPSGLAIVFADLVESVRMMEEHEDETVQRWLLLLAHIEDEIVPAHAGRLVKSTGDGVMLEFPDSRVAARAAMDLLKTTREFNALYEGQEPLELRVGVHATNAWVTDRDMFGKGINLAARLMTLAGPGEVVVSAEVRDSLTADLDNEIEDLGECYVKHIVRPLRAYRLGPPSQTSLSTVAQTILPGKPSVALIPFTANTSGPGDAVVGAVLADCTIAALSRCADIHVISRLSTLPFAGRAIALSEVRDRLNAGYVLSGGCQVLDDRVMLSIELADTRTGHVVWADMLRGSVKALLNGEDEIAPVLAQTVARHVNDSELRRVQTLPLPNLESWSLLMGSISLMHRTGASDFARSRQLLEGLIYRHNRAATPMAWLAKWHVLRAVQGWAPQPEEEGRLAIAQAKRAVDLDPQASLPVTMIGLVHAYLLVDFETADQCYASAIALNPNESLAWLLRGAMYAFKGLGAQAQEATEYALSLSPLDPLKYFYDSLSASAAVTAGDYPRAIELAQRSLRANRAHASTYRALAMAQAESGMKPEAKQTIAKLLQIDPNYTVRTFLQRHPGRHAAPDFVAHLADALAKAGLPA